MKSFKILLITTFIGLSGYVNAQVQDTTIIVNGICGMCKSTIEKACDLKGIKKAEWNVETKQLVFSYDPEKVSFETIHQSILDSGYDTEFELATDEAYNAIHACCKYRDPSVHEAHQKKKK